MTTPRYQHGCAAGSQECGEAAAWSSASAWNVNFNNGNVNNNHRNNNGFALAVRRASEFQGAVPLQSLYQAWRRARRQKVPSHNQLRFDSTWMDGLLHLQVQIHARNWRPRRSSCFIATRPKAREIHAPDFADRVVHHWLVPQLEAVYEPRFIHDSYANRVGKGSHAAVRTLQGFVRQVSSGQGGGYYLQLDIANFFNSIHRPTLWAQLKPVLQRASISAEALHVTHALLSRDPVRAGVDVRATPEELAAVPPHKRLHVTHALLSRDPVRAGVDVRATPEELAAVPPHKRLHNAAPGCGLPIGNLSSQFFANVYLDALDQFVKHELKAKRYLRYVDDFVLVHHDREQLVEWQARITDFLRTRLQLSLKADIRLRPLGDGIDFLGYVIHPTHTLARRRVVVHARETLQAWERTHVRGDQLHGTPEDLRRIACVIASYQGHLRHANSHRLQLALLTRFPWITSAARPRRFSHRLEGRRISISYRSTAP